MPHFTPNEALGRKEFLARKSADIGQRAAAAFACPISRGAGAPAEVEARQACMRNFRLDRLRAHRTFNFLKRAPLEILTFAVGHFRSPSDRQNAGDQAGRATCSKKRTCLGDSLVAGDFPLPSAR